MAVAMYELIHLKTYMNALAVHVVEMNPTQVVVIIDSSTKQNLAEELAKN